jgi:hypothetical protein
VAAWKNFGVEAWSGISAATTMAVVSTERRRIGIN